MSWSNRNLGLRLLAESSQPYPRLHSSAAPRLSNLVMYFLLGAYTKRRASEVITKSRTAKLDSLQVLAYTYSPHLAALFTLFCSLFGEVCS